MTWEKPLNNPAGAASAAKYVVRSVTANEPHPSSPSIFTSAYPLPVISKECKARLRNPNNFTFCTDSRGQHLCMLTPVISSRSNYLFYF